MLGSRYLAILATLLISCNAQPLQSISLGPDNINYSLQARQNVASLAASCQTLKKKTNGAAWNMYYAGSGLIRSDSYAIAQVPASNLVGSEPGDICKVANDVTRSCSQFATSLNLKQMALAYTAPPVNITARDSWTCLLWAADNSNPSLFNSPAPWADYLWAWTQT